MSSRESMKAMVVRKRGSASSLVAARVPRPSSPTGHDILVRVKACSINPIDIKVRSGIYDDYPDYYSRVPPEAPDSTEDFQILGYDGAGVVEAVGPDVKNRFNEGDKVYYSGNPVRHGSNAEWQLVDGRSASRMPKNYSFAEAAALPLTWITAWEALVERLEIKKGDNSSTVLIINGAGGVGAVACQIARKVLGMKTVIATTSRPETTAFAKEMGATHTVNHHEDVVQQIKDLKLDIPIRYIFITRNTEEYLAKSAAICAPFGRVCSIVQTKQMDKMYGTEFMAKSLTFVWCLLGTKPVYGVDLNSHGEILDQLSKLVDDGVAQTHLKSQERLSLDGLRKAHEVVESGKSIGKVVCSVDVAGEAELWA